LAGEVNSQPYFAPFPFGPIVRAIFHGLNGT
jgi:hypothetical protein